VLVFVKVFVSMATLGEVNQVAEVVKHLLHYLQGKLISAFSCLSEFLIVVSDLYLRSVKEQGVEGG
jgi:hypothetical protein